jgi:hypothetical protein
LIADIWETLSFSEIKLKKMEKDIAELIDYNATHLSRIFPKSTRIDSSNYNPMHAWVLGIHMAAMNIQTV